VRAAALALALFAGVALAEDPFEGLPQVVSSVPMSSPVDASGIAVEARAVRTRLAPDDAFRWLLKRFTHVGLYVPPEASQPQLHGAPQLTGYDPAARRSYTAIFLKNADRTTTLLLGTADLSKPPRPNTAELPVMPGARGVVTTRSEGGQVVSYAVGEGREKVEAFHAGALRAAGWAKDEASGTWSKAGRSLTVVLRADRAATLVLLEELSQP